MWLKASLLTLTILGVAGAGALLYGSYSWRADTRELHERMESERSPGAMSVYDARELEDLPAPVRRYFRAALPDGQPTIAAVEVEHTGTFDLGAEEERWRPFTSNQRVVTLRPGFVWDARISMMPGMPVHVHDAYVAGEGILRARLYGLVTVMEQSASPELAEGELMRFFAEGAWYPTALLPSQGVRWEGIDEGRAAATLADGDTSVRLEVRFDERGMIRSVRSEGRYREVDGELVATPWEGRFWDYEERDGMLVPLEGEVAWLLPQGRKPYWHGSIERIEYEYAR